MKRTVTKEEQELMETFLEQSDPDDEFPGVDWDESGRTVNDPDAFLDYIARLKVPV